MLQATYTSPDKYTFQTYYSPPENSKLVFIAHHGTGSSSQSFQLFHQSLTTLDPSSTPGLFTFDMRGHAKSNTLNESIDPQSNYNLSISQLVSDFSFIFSVFTTSVNTDASIYLIGHSLGGSILTKYLTHAKADANLNPRIKGLAVVDIVEELAISSLPLMEQYIYRLPKSFQSIDAVINYYVDHNQISNRESLQYSIPPLVRQNENGTYQFILDLSKSKPYWDDWFKDLSMEFTALPNSIAKLLLLANNNYIDKGLIIGQMQGKFQLIVINNTGHFIHEDIPLQFARIMLDFVERNNFDLYHHPNSTSSTNANLIKKFNEQWKSKRV